jgi:hypothetical protein
MEFEEFEIDYDELSQNKGTFNDNCAQYMYDHSHDIGGIFNTITKPENTGTQLETIKNNQAGHYDIDSYFNSTSFSAEPEFPQIEELAYVAYQNVHNTCDSRVAMNYAFNKAQDFSKQLPSSEENHRQGFLSTGDSSTSFSHNNVHVPCMDHFNMGSPFNMNSPMDTTAACTPSISVKEEKGDGQNARRNMPVLIVQRVKQSFLDAIPVSGKKARSNGGRLDYIYSILNMSVSAENLPAFREFLNSLDFGNKRTWTVIQEQFATKKADFVHVLLDGIERFLSEVGAGDFHAWVEENKKMKAANKKVLYDSKGWFRTSFADKFGDNKIHF